MYYYMNGRRKMNVQLRENIKQAAVELGIPVIRYERTYPARDTAFIWCPEVPSYPFLERVYS